MKINIGAILRHGFYGALMFIAGAMLGRPAAVHAQEFAWARSAGGSGADYGNGVAVDAAGNSIVVGTFADMATFGTGVVLTGGGLFLATYNPEGVLIAVTRAADGGSGRAIAVDPVGNIIVTGTFSGTVTFGEGSDAITLNSVGDIDSFVAKWGRDGALIWAKQATGSCTYSDSDVTADPAGNIIFPHFSFQGIPGRPGSCSDATISKYTAGGSPIWQIQIEEGSRNGYVAADMAGNVLVVALSVSIDGKRRVVVSKYMANGESAWDDGVIVSLPNMAESARPAADDAGNIFVIGSNLAGNLFKLSSDGGQQLWAVRVGGSPKGIAVDAARNIIVRGTFSGTATFGEGDNTTALTAAGADPSTFLAKYASDGALIWAKKVGTIKGPENQGTGQGISSDVAGNSIFTGSFSGSGSVPTTIGEGSNNETHLTSAGASDMFVAKWFDTPLAQTENLIDSIGQFVRQGILNEGQGNALGAKLKIASKSLELQNVNGACTQIGAFVNHVDALTNMGQLPQLQGKGLSVAGNSLLRPGLGCQ